MKPTERAKQALAYKLVDYLCDDPENNMATIMGKIDVLAPASLFAEQRAAFSDAIKNKTNMYQLIMRVMDLNPEVRADLLKTFIVDANFLAWGKQEKMRERHQCNIPWAILLDPTSACNLHCTGCWAAEYGHALNLAYDEIDSIIRQGKELGVHVYIYTGGEPLVRKRDLIRLCEAHPDCAFLCFTNSTLIDEGFCQEMIRVKNFVPAISAEGDEAATDGRRGAGTYAKVDAAMDLLAEPRAALRRVHLLHPRQRALRGLRRVLRLAHRQRGSSSPGSSPTCPWARARRPSSCPRRTTANCSTISIRRVRRRSPS